MESERKMMALPFTKSNQKPKRLMAAGREKDIIKIICQNQMTNCFIKNVRKNQKQ